MHRNREVLAVIDTQVMIPAFAYHDPQHAFYLMAIRKCWKFVFSDQIIEEYQRVIQNFGFRGEVVIHELNKLQAMNKCRISRADHQIVGDDLAPRKDKHIVAVCQDIATVLVSNDRGILQRKELIEKRLGVAVHSVEMALQVLGNSPDCS